jgi:phosphate transport system substrate-binding protein
MRWKRGVLSAVLFVLVSACSLSSSSSTTLNSHTITNRGSDTMVNLALAWAEAYAKEYPQMEISVSGGGSGTGITALSNNTVDIANVSRAMTQTEIQDAQKNGVYPKQFIVARDAIAVIVNPSNPVTELTLRQVSDIFSGKINNWTEVGGENRSIVRVSREVNSGTHVFFLESVIRLGDSKNTTIFSADTLLLPSSEGITSEVSQNPNAIGYDGLGYVTPAVKVLRLSPDPAGPFVGPSKETVLDHTYAISRDLYMYTNGDPTGRLKDYLDWIRGAEAQRIVADLGFIPIT